MSLKCFAKLTIVVIFSAINIRFVEYKTFVITKIVILALTVSREYFNSNRFLF